MNSRKIEERAEFPNGIKTEWEPSRLPTRGASSDKDYRALVIEANKKSKAEGSWLRYRSVIDE